jgi:hypothetical protein
VALPRRPHAISRSRACRASSYYPCSVAAVALATLVGLGSGGAARAQSLAKPASIVSVAVRMDPIAITARGGEAWLVGRPHPSSRTGSLLRLQEPRLRSAHVSAVGGMPTDVVVAGNSLWISGAGSDRSKINDPNSVIRISMATGRRVAIVRVSDPAALSADRRAVWALSSGGGRNFSLLRRIQISQNRVTASIRIRGTNFRPALAVGGGFVWVLTAADLGASRRWIVTRVSTATDRVSGKSVPLNGIGQDIAYGGGAAWVTTIRSRGERSFGEIRRIPVVGRQSVVTQSLPSAGLLAAYGTTVWVVTGAHRISLIDTRSGRLTPPSISVPVSINSLAAQRDRLWIVDRLRKRVALVGV